MNLGEYIEKNGGQTEIAQKLGVTQGLISQWLKGKTRVTPERAKQIELVTGGVVTRQELRPDSWDETAP